MVTGQARMEGVHFLSISCHPFLSFLRFRQAQDWRLAEDAQFRAREYAAGAETAQGRAIWNVGHVSAGSM